jgi:hypothetical protein
LRARPIRDRFRRNVRRRRRADVRRLLVHDVRNLWRAWSVGSSGVLEHAVIACNLGTICKADLNVGLYGFKPAS